MKALFRKCCSDYRGNYGLKAVYKMAIGKEIEATHHRGGDDATNIATMLGTLLMPGAYMYHRISNDHHS